MTEPVPLLTVRNLSVIYPTLHGDIKALEDISLTIRQGQTLAVIGESGCGKSTLARALPGVLPPPGIITAGTITMAAKTSLNLADSTEDVWKTLRGKEISMILQDPVQALNPVLSVGYQMVEPLRIHKHLPYKQARLTCLHFLELLEIEEPERVFKAYPFQLSGGMCQRVAIAIALTCKPKILVADEPTTALDVLVQDSIIRLIKRLQKELDIALILISHDIGVAAAMADEIAVMYGGRIIEIGTTTAILHKPAHPYTRGLLACFPDSGGRIVNDLPGSPPPLTHLEDKCTFLPRCRLADELCRQSAFPLLTQPTNSIKTAHYVSCHHPLNYNGPQGREAADDRLISATSFASFNGGKSVDSFPLLQVKGISKSFSKRQLLGKKESPYQALDGIDIAVQKGEIVGVVGASGCGKTTLARCILRLEEVDSGEIYYNGVNLCAQHGHNLRTLRRQIQPVFQSPETSLNPRRSVLDLVQEPLYYFETGLAAERKKRAEFLLNMVGIDSELFQRRSRQLSTGQCQRVAIARALALEPELLICDEPVSALDLSVQAQILTLLAELHTRLNFSMLFISHNILVVQAISNRIVVMKEGRVCETLSGLTAHKSAHHPYTRALFQAVPRLPEEQSK
jgi:peptide/nickel transport system ATP-binding protein